MAGSMTKRWNCASLPSCHTATMPPAELTPNDEIRQTMQRMLDENAKAAAAVVAGAQQVKDEAIAARLAARKALRKTEQTQESLKTDFYKTHRARIEKDYKNQLNRHFAGVLLRHGQMPDEVAALLGMPEEEVFEISRHFGYSRWDAEKEAGKPAQKRRKIGSAYARVAFQDEGRGGTAIFQWGQIVCRFWYELAGRDALLFIDVPSEQHWEAQTGIPLSWREKILHFIGERAATDQSSHYQYRIEATAIVIY